MVRQILDDRFQREGDDLVVHARIRLEDALSEGKVDVPHLDGRVLRVPLKEVGVLKRYRQLSVCLLCSSGAHRRCIGCPAAAEGHLRV